MEVTELNEFTYPEKTRYLEIKDQDIEKQRYWFFKDAKHGWLEETRAESDTHIYWAGGNCIPKWNKKTGIWLKRSSTVGCTYNKTKKTFKWWFGKQASMVGGNVLTDICNYFKVEWFNNIPAGLKVSTTNTNMNKVLLGKITNPRDLIKAIIKTNPTLRGMTISAELLWDFINLNPGTRIQSLCDMLSVAKDPNHAIEYIYAKGYYDHNLTDLLRQAHMLNRKINFKWSAARMREVHADWTKEIMDIEQEKVENTVYDYVGELSHNGHLELITNSKDLYLEGRIMHHCVYTNYAKQVEAKTYFVLKYTDRNVRATVGIKVSYTDAWIDQMYAVGNEKVDEQHKDNVKEWLSRPEVQHWFKVNSNNLVPPMLKLDELAAV